MLELDFHDIKQLYRRVGESPLSPTSERMFSSYFKTYYAFT